MANPGRKIYSRLEAEALPETRLGGLKFLEPLKIGLLSNRALLFRIFCLCLPLFIYSVAFFFSCVYSYVQIKKSSSFSTLSNPPQIVTKN